jgi:hypothetical protein
VRAVPCLSECTLAFALQLRKKHAETSVRVEALTTQADTVQYKNNEQYNTQNKRLTQSSTMSQNNKKQRIRNIENTFTSK